jgi:hypothetical protein
MWRGRAAPRHMRADRCAQVLLLLVFVGLVAGCAPLADQDQLRRDPVANTELRAGGWLCLGLCQRRRRTRELVPPYFRQFYLPLIQRS